MKILLLGEYSGLHLNLSEGLKILGHDVTIVSDGDGFKNFDRDIDIRRKSSGLYDTLHNIKTLLTIVPRLKNYDIVQIINPNFTNQNTRINLLLYRYLKRNNKKVFLGAFGDDYYWLKACLDQKFKYSEFYIEHKANKLIENEKIKSYWLNNYRKKANIEIAKSCDGIIACLYEYYIAYKDFYPDKLSYIPLPINTDRLQFHYQPLGEKIKFFIGVNNVRDEFKGTNILYKMLLKLKKNYPNQVSILKVESISYVEYIEYLKKADVVLDQIYSYTPAMNGLLAMALGKLLVGGGEPEMYDLLGNIQNRPIINVFPSQNSIYQALEAIVLNRENIPSAAANSRLFVENNHNYVHVAQQYLNFWASR